MSLLLPDRHTQVRDSLVGQAARLLAELPDAVPVARAWIISRGLFPGQPFTRFVLVLDVLAALDLVQLRGSLLVRGRPDAATIER
jgi:hypothetical protein